LEKNNRVQDRYKIPSALAWEHQEGGLLGSILNFTEINRKTKDFGRLL